MRKHWTLAGLATAALLAASLLADVIVVRRADSIMFLTAGLEAQYDFLKGGDDQVLDDISGNSRDGQLGSTTGSDSNDPTWVTDDRLDFDGVNDWVETPAALRTALDGEAEASIYYVVKLDNSPPIGNRDGLDNFGGSSLKTRYPYTANGDFLLETFRTSRPSVSDTSGISLTDWHVMCVTQKSGAGNWLFYINEVEVNAATGDTTVSVRANNKFGISDSTTFPMEAQIAYLLLYSTFHSVADQATTYAALKDAVAGRSISLP